MNVIWSQITFWGELIGKRSDHMKWRANYCINDHILNFLLLKNMLNVSVLVLGKFVFLLKVEIARISNLKLEIVKLGRNWTFSLQITFRSRSWTELRSFRGKRIVNWTRSRNKGSALTLRIFMAAQKDLHSKKHQHYENFLTILYDLHNTKTH